jgi:peroxiredoxin
MNDHEALPEPDPLPQGLPRPIDDGAARHLPGRQLPALAFLATDGSWPRIDSLCDGRWLLFIYPLTGKPGEDVPPGWNEIPGARGCSQEACSFRDSFAALMDYGVERVFALSSDRAEYQQALVQRFKLPYLMLSDPELRLAHELRLPTFDGLGMTLYKRLTMIIRRDVIEHVFYPIFPPYTHGAEVLDWLRTNPRGVSQL